jgi:hypothetical protein
MCRRDADAMGANLDIAKGREVLPKNVKPLHYHLTLEPNLETFEYEGKVVIEYVPLIVRFQYVLCSDIQLVSMSSRTPHPSR